MSGEKCCRCGEEGEDRRTLHMACFYAMEELGLPFEKEVLFHAELKDLKKVKDPVSFDLKHGEKPFKLTIAPGTVKCKGELTPHQLYTLRVCKDCRADWMQAIKEWFKQNPKLEKSCGSGIFVRRNGSTVEITEDEWRRENPDREPVRWKG